MVNHRTGGEARIFIMQTFNADPIGSYKATTILLQLVLMGAQHVLSATLKIRHA